MSDIAKRDDFSTLVEIAKAIRDGKLEDWEWEGQFGRWHSADGQVHETLYRIAAKEPHRLRRKPRTVTLTVTMPQPLKTAEDGQMVFYAGDENEPYLDYYEPRTEWHVAALRKGYFYATKADAEAADAAMSAARLAMMEAVK